jgi:hypothetical protein
MLKPFAIIAVVVGLGFQPAKDSGPQSPDRPLSEYRAQTLNSFSLLVRRDADKDETRYRRVLAALAFDFDTISRVVPADALTALHSVRIVITPATGARNGLSGRGMCYHDSAGWLTANGFDAERAGTVEILNMDDFLTWRAEQPMMLLHELAHAYHAMLGFDREDVQKVYEAAKASHKYDSVHYVLLPEGKTKPAYAMNNAREYFAELTEAFFGRNDFEPFTHDELLAFDSEGAAVVDRLWRFSAEEIDQAKAARKHELPVVPRRTKDER